MSILSRKSGLAILLVALSLSAPAARAQVALPLNYWVPGGPFGFGGGLTGVQGFSSYSNFPTVDFSNAGGVGFSNQPDSWFISSQSGTVGIGANSFGFTQADTLGSIGTLNYQSVNFGYNFKDETALRR